MSRKRLPRLLLKVTTVRQLDDHCLTFRVPVLIYRKVDLAVPTAAILFCKILRVASDIETNSGEAESDGNQERKRRAPHGHVPPLAPNAFLFL